MQPLADFGAEIILFRGCFGRGQRFLDLFEENNHQRLIAFTARHQAQSQPHGAYGVRLVQAYIGVHQFLAGAKHLLNACRQGDGQFAIDHLGDVIDSTARRQGEYAACVAKYMLDFQMFIHHYRQRGIGIGQRVEQTVCQAILVPHADPWRTGIARRRQW